MEKNFVQGSDFCLLVRAAILLAIFLKNGITALFLILKIKTLITVNPRVRLLLISFSEKQFLCFFCLELGRKNLRKTVKWSNFDGSWSN